MKKLAAFSTLVIASLVVVPQAFAQITVNTCPQQGFGPLCNLRLDGGLVQTLITIAFIIAALIALAFLIFGGIKWILSGGDKAGVEAARQMIVAAVIGLVITFAAYIIINIVFAFFGLGGLGREFQIPSLRAGSSRPSQDFCETNPNANGC